MFTKIIQEVIDRSQDQLSLLIDRVKKGENQEANIQELSQALIEGSGEVLGVYLANQITECYCNLRWEKKVEYFNWLDEYASININALEDALHNYRNDPSVKVYRTLMQSAEAGRQELFRRINFSSMGPSFLLVLRQDLLLAMKADPGLGRVDLDLVHILSSWFNRGFLSCRRIDWNSPAALLEKLISYESVHDITSWQDLRNRIDPPDRNCYAFFHPSLEGEPLIFVEVALTQELSSSITGILDPEHKLVDPGSADTAVFYSISNCQVGLRGISFGAFLLKQVMKDLAALYPGLKRWVTLSPVPGFTKWLMHRDEQYRPTLNSLKVMAPDERQSALLEIQEDISDLALEYFFGREERPGYHHDPVARFHLGNGAELYRIINAADVSDTGIERSMGLMVNYQYDSSRIAINHETFQKNGSIARSSLIPKAK